MASWGAKVVVDIGDYTGDTGFLLHYYAHAVRDIIRERTASGRAVDGSAFAPYRSRHSLELNDDGTIKRNAKGQWSTAETRGTGDKVTLRSPYNVPAGKRMMDNLVITPRILDAKKLEYRKITTAYVKPMGQRAVASIIRGKERTGEGSAVVRQIRQAGSAAAAAKAAGLKRKEFKAAMEAVNVHTENVGHQLRGRTCQDGKRVIKTREGTKTISFQKREFVGISASEWAGIRTTIQRDHVLAFIKDSKRSVRRQVGKKARAAAQRAMRARKRGADAKAQAAEAQHRTVVERYRSLFGDRAV